MRLLSGFVIFTVLLLCETLSFAQNPTDPHGIGPVDPNDSLSLELREFEKEQIKAHYSIEYFSSDTAVIVVPQYSYGDPTLKHSQAPYVLPNKNGRNPSNTVIVTITGATNWGFGKKLSMTVETKAQPPEVVLKKLPRVVSAVDKITPRITHLELLQQCELDTMTRAPIEKWLAQLDEERFQESLSPRTRSVFNSKDDTTILRKIYGYKYDAANKKKCPQSISEINALKKMCIRAFQAGLAITAESGHKIPVIKSNTLCGYNQSSQRWERSQWSSYESNHFAVSTLAGNTTAFYSYSEKGIYIPTNRDQSDIYVIPLESGVDLICDNGKNDDHAGILNGKATSPDFQENYDGGYNGDPVKNPRSQGAVSLVFY